MSTVEDLYRHYEVLDSAGASVSKVTNTWGREIVGGDGRACNKTSCVLIRPVVLFMTIFGFRCCSTKTRTSLCWLPARRETARRNWRLLSFPSFSNISPSWLIRPLIRCSTCAKKMTPPYVGLDIRDTRVSVMSLLV